jgi:enoyl-CoA hydratase
MPGQVALSLQGRIGQVTLSHPGKLNAMSRAMWRQLREAFEQVQASTELRCVVVRGEGGAFCAGGDISEYPAFRFDEATLRDFHENDVWGGLAAMLACDVPLIACIEGPCMGAGMEIASCCDIRVAEAPAKFGAPIARLGFPMAPREAQLVARAAGELTAREMLLEAAALDAAEMKARGFLNQVVAQGGAAAECAHRAERIAQLAPGAARLNKSALRALLIPDFKPNRAPGRMDIARAAPDSIADVEPGAYAYAPGAEHREGIAAFLAKRRPDF